MKRAVWGHLLVVGLLTSCDRAVAQQCQVTGTNQTCTNSIALSGGVVGLSDTATATVINTSGASITGGSAGGGKGINTGLDAIVTNSGTISGTGDFAQGVVALRNNTVMNNGAITADAGFAGTAAYAVNGGNDITLTNSGTISAHAFGGAAAVFGFHNVTASNTGRLTATSGLSGTSYGVFASQILRLTNSGTITSVAGGSGIAYGAYAGDYVDVTNSGSITSAGSTNVSYGIAALNGAADVTNSGTISSSSDHFGFGILTGLDATVRNSGTIAAVSSGEESIAINAGRNAFVTNSGSITAAVLGTGQSYGVLAVQNATVSNSGTIVAAASGAGRGVGIFANTTAAIVNSGSISGTTAAGGMGLGIQSFGPTNVTNSGTISGSTAALDLSGNADTLTVLPGSRIIGAINLGGGGDTVNFRGGSHNLTFDTLAGATVTGTTPFVVSGNRAVAVDPTAFAAAGRTLNDFSRAIFDTVPVFSGSSAPGSAPLAFAAPDAPSRVDDAFAAIPGLSAYSDQGLAFKNPTVAYGDGSTVWGRGFAGQRIQQQDGVLLRTTNLFYGGMIGGDWQTRPDLRLGAYLGGGQTRSTVDFNQGTTNADLVFGGAYARYDVGASFLHAAIQASGSRNTTSRTINNNLVAGGLETASASYDGWYVSPEASFGHRWMLGSFAGANYTLTPSFRLRYLYGSYAGYTETGTTAPLTVSGQTVSTLEERGEAKLTRSAALSPSSLLSTSISVGVLGTQRVGSNTVNAALLGQALPFATPGQSNVYGGFGGIGLEWQSRNVTLFSTAEYLALSDRSTIVTGRAGLRVAF
jgi:hypothetical protein